MVKKGLPLQPQASDSTVTNLEIEIDRPVYLLNKRGWIKILGFTRSPPTLKAHCFTPRRCGLTLYRNLQIVHIGGCALSDLSQPPKSTARRTKLRSAVPEFKSLNYLKS